jgi:methylthioribose-1-phosphate isomerase
MRNALKGDTDLSEQIEIAFNEAHAIVEDDIETCRMIGVHGLPLLEPVFVSLVRWIVSYLFQNFVSQC